MHPIVKAVLECNADGISSRDLKKLFPFRKHIRMSVLAMWIVCYNDLSPEKRDQFLVEMRAKGLDVNAAYLVVIKEYPCNYTYTLKLTGLSQAITTDFCELALQRRYNMDCVRALLAVGANPEAPYCRVASDSGDGFKARESVLEFVVRQDMLQTARILLSRDRW
jgi:hypothetical protein